VVAAALFFTIHHSLALNAFFAWPVVALGTFGVFTAGAVWSWCYSRYASIWPGYVSHIAADIAIFWVGWQLLF